MKKFILIVVIAMMRLVPALAQEHVTYSWGKIYLDGEKISNSEFREIATNPGLYTTGTVFRGLGIGITSVGLAADVLGGYMLYEVNHSEEPVGAVVLAMFSVVTLAAGLTATGVGLVSWGSGRLMINSAVNRYNRSMAPYLELGSTDNGFGLALRF